jgi:hypothetical protein
MEALFSRGFTDASSVLSMSQADFEEALTGTVAFSNADDIQAGQQSITAPGKVQEGFKPVNPDGSLTNCIPPLHLSPF